jgi:hypothetical protein
MRVWDPIAGRERDHRPPCQAEIEETARRILDEAGVQRTFPTPIQPIARVLGIGEDEWPRLDRVDLHTTRLPHAGAAAVNWALEKTSAVKIGESFSVNPFIGPRRQRKAAFHEFAHKALPWHRISAARDLTPAGHSAFDPDANAFADELLFQGAHFDALAGSMPFRVESVTRLADLYKSPWHDTLVRFVERRREPVALLISGGDAQQIVAASAAIVELGSAQDLITTRVESFQVGLKIVGVRRYELVTSSRLPQPLRLRLVA